MHIIGLTGGVACGKSTVSRHLKGKGIPIVDADLLAREVVEPGTSGYKAVVKCFGMGILQGGQYGAPIDRPALGKVVFSDETKRKVLNGIVHKRVTYAMIFQMVKAFLWGDAFIVLDVPLMIEAGMHKLVSRMRERDGLSEEEATLRINAQMSNEEKRKFATFEIENTSTLDSLLAEIDSVCHRIGFNESRGNRYPSIINPRNGVLLCVVLTITTAAYAISRLLSL